MSDLTSDIHALHCAALKAKYNGDEEDFHLVANPETIVGLCSLLKQMSCLISQLRKKNVELQKELNYSVPLRLYREALESKKGELQ